MSISPIVLVLAAGKGTRMRSGRAKVLHEVAGRPLVVWAVEAARVSASEVVVVVGHQREEVEAVLAARYGGEVKTAYQAEQRGTGHAVQVALESLGDQPDDRVIAVINGDSPGLDGALIGRLAEAAVAASSGMAMLSTRAADPTGYGRLIRNASGNLARIVEEADATEDEREIEEVNAGFYAFRLRALRAGIATLESDNAQGELYLTDMAERAAATGDVAIIETPFDAVRGVNDRVELADVDATARRTIAERWMREGVTVVAPEQTFIDADVATIGQDSWIGPGACLRGATRIGSGVRIDAGAVLTDVEVADRAWIKPYSVLADSSIGPEAQVGPFSHCRPGTVIDTGARLGNFVETKKTHMRAGAKANHHAYLGDASIGAGANVGAGTICCNYDGFNKHRTTIEDGAFIGTNTELVAPVTVGKNAYVGAGTTVTMDVPRSSLALSRTKQVNIEGWADRFREAQRKRKSRKG
jgi:bifunctional UDP-N-acetylglucosamine pyrophosphorylase/glucosamine-1-phosphate N-acetyltransferase